ncbi:hypothetical protein GCM10023205_71150 [Yinghuangia aomiensis]|uniref:NlpC/P60 domain-containing protein n=2 Tax=Yinghuangia aomiensis TaxID=676205 RepID=A0ABP9I830_9ACTN
MKVIDYVGLSEAAKKGMHYSKVVINAITAAAQQPACDLVSPALLAAQLTQESNANTDPPDSSAGAQGISQFMPGTWNDLVARGRAVDGNGDKKYDIRDPQDAIPTQAYFDCEVAEKVANVPGDRIDNMLAAYNAGPGAVIKAGGVPPYGETQKYVKNIRTNMETYATQIVASDTSPASTIGLEIVRQARQEIGLPYIWGGGDKNGPTGGGFDCSGLVLYAVYQARRAMHIQPDVPLAHYTGYQVKDGTGQPVADRAQMQPGDAIYIWAENSGRGDAAPKSDPVHVVIWTGSVRDPKTGATTDIIEAPRPGRNVRAATLSQYAGRQIAIRRFS